MAKASASKLTVDERRMVAACEKNIGYQFKRPELLIEALTHASGATTRLQSNERLEFFGDSILGFVVCEWLFRKHPQFLEGDLTRAKSVIVSRTTCVRLAEAIELPTHLRIGKGMLGKEAIAEKLPDSLSANAFESVVAAIYLDSGIRAVRRFLLPLLERHVPEILAQADTLNYKSELQQFAHRELNKLPTYVVLEMRGPEHKKCFQVCVEIGSKRFPAAWGNSKKAAEQRAASNALAELVKNVGSAGV